MALLAEGEKYGAQLRSEFEARTGGTWPLNVGQVYTTLDRLVRDGLVESAGTPDADGRIAYRLTPGGHAELRAWWVTPVDRTNTPASPRVLHGREEIRQWIEDVCGREMNHRIETPVVGADRVAFTEACRYPDGTNVLCATVLELDEERIARQVAVQAWDE